MIAEFRQGMPGVARGVDKSKSPEQSKAGQGYQGCQGSVTHVCVQAWVRVGACVPARTRCKSTPGTPGTPDGSLYPNDLWEVCFVDSKRFALADIWHPWQAQK
jgi:hypothetical protein